MELMVGKCFNQAPMMKNVIFKDFFQFTFTKINALQVKIKRTFAQNDIGTTELLRGEMCNDPYL